MSMEVMIFNQIRTLRCDGIACALLRDNVQHYLENTFPSGRFQAIHALADSRWAGAVETLRPRSLSSELQTAWPCLRELPIEGLAISIRTRAALTNASVPPQVRGTILHRLVHWPIPFDIRGLATLADLFGGLVAELDRLVREARPDALLLTRSVAATVPPTRKSPCERFFVPTTSRKWQH